MNAVLVHLSASNQPNVGEGASWKWVQVTDSILNVHLRMGMESVRRIGQC